MKELRIVIAGGRDFNNYELLKSTAETVIDTNKHNDEQITIVSGVAKGADTLGEQFAKEFGYNLKRFPADWDKIGKYAGYFRNEEMAKFASEEDNGMLIAFWDTQSRGTKHMIDMAKKYNLRTFIVNYPRSKNKERFFK